MIKNIIVVLMAFLFGSVIYAQNQSQVILTWQARNFYPADYLGKALGTPGSSIVVAAEILKNNKLVDSSRAVFNWSLDGKLLQSGQGLKEVVFTSKKQPGDDHFVGVSIKIGEEIFENSVRIGVQEPSLVIEAKFPNQEVKVGEEVELKATPFFFNVSFLQDLIFFWQIGNEKRSVGGEENLLLLTIGRLPSGSQKTIRVLSTAQNKKNPLEFKNESVQLKILE